MGFLSGILKVGFVEKYGLNLKTLGDSSYLENLVHRINYELFYMHESRN